MKLTSLILILALYSTLSASENAVEIFGTDLLEPWLPEAIADANASTFTSEWDPKFKLTGSYSGLIALQNGYTDACFYLQTSSTNPELPEDFEQITLFYKVLYFHAPDSFPQRSISVSSITNLSRNDDLCASRSWGNVLTESSDWSIQKPRIIVNSGPKNIIESLYRLKFVSDKNTSDVVEFIPESDITIAMAKSPWFLMVSDSTTPPEVGMKTLSIIAQGDNIGFPPTNENVRYRDYSISFPLQLIYRKETVWSKELINLLMSPEMNEVFTHFHFVTAN